MDKTSWTYSINTEIPECWFIVMALKVYILKPNSSRHVLFTFKLFLYPGKYLFILSDKKKGPKFDDNSAIGGPVRSNLVEAFD